MIDSNDIRRMIVHWLDTPPNGYFAQGYGSDVKVMLLRELSADNADALLEKLRQDIPLLAGLNDSQLRIETATQGFDTLLVYLRVGSIEIMLSEPQTDTTNQDYYDVRAQ